MIIGSFGASAIMVYGEIESPLAQPRNLIGGHLLSAVIGVFCYQILAPHLWIAGAILNTGAKKRTPNNLSKLFGSRSESG